MSEPIEDNGSKMECTKCKTEWWTKRAGRHCPVCDRDVQFGTIFSTIRENLQSHKTAGIILRAKIDELEALRGLCERLEDRKK